MDNQFRLRIKRAAWLFGGAAFAILLAGCQGYERAPLDLRAHFAEFERRAIRPEPLSDFVMRLAASGDSTPEHFDMADGLSPAEGEVLALFYNPDLRLMRLDAGISLASFDTAGLWADPEFGFDAAEVLSPAGMFEYGLTLSLTIPVSGRLEVEKDRAGAAHEAELRRIKDAEWSLRAQVRSAWAVWAAAAERVRLLGEVIEQVERIASITDRLVNAGELTRVESRLIRAEALSVRTDLIAARHAELDAKLHLLGLMGLPPDADVDLHAVFPGVEAPRVEGEDELSRILACNTTLGWRRAEYQVAEETLRLEIRKQYPDITIGGGYGNEDDDRLLLGVSLPIPILNANRAGIAEARARRDRARTAAEATLERLTREFAAARGAAQAARERRRLFEDELVPLLDEQSIEVERIVELGEIDTLLLLESVTRRCGARSTLLELRAREIEAINDITRLLGPDPGGSPGSLQPPHSIPTRSETSPAEEIRR